MIKLIKLIKGSKVSIGLKTATIPGISLISSALFISEFEDFSKFSNSNQVLSFARL